MRILHTSDWHVGRTFHGRDLLTEQEEVLGGLAGTVAAGGVDLVVVSGDVYDRALPSTESVRLCSRVLGRLREAGATIVVTSGNHDSAGRLGFGAEFAAAGGLHLCTDVASAGTPVVLRDAYGEVAVYGLPYLEPETARHGLGDPTLTGHAAVLGAAMDRVRADLATRPVGTRSVVLAHAFVVGGEASDSERTISVGGVETVPAGIFDGVDYVALGHLHGAQRITDRVRYSGSPLPYSFSEARHVKSVWLVDLDADGLAAVRRHPLPVPRPLSTLGGPIEELLADPAHEAVTGHFVSVTLTDAVRPPDPLRRLQARFPHAVHLEWRPVGGQAGDGRRYTERVRGRGDLEVAEEFVSHVRGGPAGRAERALFEEAFADSRRAAPTEEGAPVERSA